MSRRGRVLTLLLLVSLIVTTLATFAAATEGESEGDGDSVTTTTAVDSGLSPAVPISDNEAAPAEPDWTYRYMVPTAIVIAVLIIAFTAVKYFTDVVRKRYRIVEE